MIAIWRFIETVISDTGGVQIIRHASLGHSYLINHHDAVDSYSFELNNIKSSIPARYHCPDPSRTVSPLVLGLPGGMVAS